MNMSTDILPRKVKSGYLKARKMLHQQWHPCRESPAILFIVGCQRSGTTLMTNIFKSDLDANVFGEFSEVNHQAPPYTMRLKPLPEVASIIRHQKAAIAVLKPLSETQNATRLLEFFNGAKVLWMYRDYNDVAASNLKKFGVDNGFNDLRQMLADSPGNWKYEGASNNIKSLVRHYLERELTPHDAAALYWYARNSLFFEHALDSREDVLMCRYDDLVLHPKIIMGKIYGYLGFDAPAGKPDSQVHSKSVGKGKDIHLSPDVDNLCRDLMARLDTCYTKVNYYGLYGQS